LSAWKTYAIFLVRPSLPPIISRLWIHTSSAIYANAIGTKRKLSIVVAEANVFMPGILGWLLKGVNTMPYALNFIISNIILIPR
jgi:hypothetical protein